jgi:hypothetical protein
MHPIFRRIVLSYACSAGIIAVAPLCHGGTPIDLCSPQIVYGKKAGPLEKLAAKEMWRYLARVSGTPGSLATDDISQFTNAAVVLIDVAGNNPLAAEIEKRENIAVDVDTLGEEGFRWKATRCRGKPALLLAAAKPAGALYGTYALLEKIGFGFYLGGDAFPAAGSPLTVDASLDETHKPAFAVRGALPWGNLPNAYWDLDDLKFIYDQLAKQRFNLVGFHQYDHEPFCAYSWQGKLVDGKPFFSNLDAHCGSMPLEVKNFAFGTSAYFDRDPFTSRTRLDGRSPDDQVRRAQKMLADSFDYAHCRGLRVCLGFELVGDPTDSETLSRMEAKIAATLNNYPQLDYIWFFQSESRSIFGYDMPKGSGLEKLVRENGKIFDYVNISSDWTKTDKAKQIAEAVRYAEFVKRAYRCVKRHRPELPVAINGWGGDRWMYFTDLFVGLDKLLPKDIIFSSQDNIEMSAAPEVSKVYAKLSPERPCWPIPWWNNDDERAMCNPRGHTKFVVPLCRDALAKRCQGMLGIYWNGRLIEETAAYQARFSWNPNLTYTGFYDDFAARCFGRKWGPRMSRILQELEGLGSRWTGADGFVPISVFSWFAADKLPKAENLRKLADIRAELANIRDDMLAQRRLEGLERLEWLTTTIDWLVRFDAAACVLYPQGPVEKLLREAESAKKNNDAAAARQKAQSARVLMNESGYRRSMLTYPKKMSVLDEFGDYVRIQTTWHQNYLALHRRVEAILGPQPDDLAGPPVEAGSPPVVVGRQPPCLASAGQNIPVSVIVVSGEPIQACTLHYRQIGADGWKEVPIHADKSFPTAYHGIIPAADVRESTGGLEWFVSVQDHSGRKTYWPKGYPSTLWSATIVPNSCNFKAEKNR